MEFTVPVTRGELYRFNHLNQRVRPNEPLSKPEMELQGIPGKNPSNPDACRPISLLSNIGKFFEKFVAEMLAEECEQLGIIPLHQFGFRSAHSAVQQAAPLAAMLRTNKRRGFIQLHCIGWNTCIFMLAYFIFPIQLDHPGVRAVLDLYAGIFRHAIPAVLPDVTFLRRDRDPETMRLDKIHKVNNRCIRLPHMCRHNTHGTVDILSLYW